MPNLPKLLRGRRSKRALAVLGGVVAIGASIANTVGTQAATQDVTTAKASQIATQNFYPVWGPNAVHWDAPSGAGCFPTSTNIWWDPNANAPAGQKYVMQEWGNSGTSLLWTSTPSTNSWYNGWSNSSGGGGTHEVRVFGVNATTGEWSTGYMSFYIYKNSCGKWLISDWQAPTNVSAWQQTTSFTPAAPQSLMSGMGLRQMVAPSTTTTTTSTPSTTRTTTDSSTSQSSASATGSPSGTATTAPSTTAPATSTTTSTQPTTTTSTTPATTTTSQ